MGLGFFLNIISIEMKKIICTMVLSFCCLVMTNAQIADGFYHIRNAGTGRYLSINDTDPNNYQVSTQSGSVNLGGIRTYINYDSVAVSPSCVIFIRRLPDGGYDISGQGSSLYAMTNYRLPIDITANGNGTYKISGTYSGITMYLTDRSPSNDDGYLISSGDMVNWTLESINTTTEFIAIHPDVKTADGAYYGTIFAGFNFRLVSPGMTAFYVSNAGGTGFTMEPIEGDVIPANTPVIIKCSSAYIEDNLIEPVIGGYDFEDPNWLGGVYCSLKAAKHNNLTLFDRITMRILGLSENGELAFVANPAPDRLYKEQFLMANKAYLKVNPGDADVMIHGKYDPQAINSAKSDDKSSTAIYTLTGIRLPDGVAPRAGIYVKNGKKMIIK
jgi:hypothetical protein